MIECVPNFSEGHDAGKVEAIVRAIAEVPGVSVLGWEFDGDHNRAVVTFAGEAPQVAEAAIRAAGKAAELIDLRLHQGVHPRVGAADVVPFVPLEGATMADCVTIAHRAGQEIWSRFGVPVYFYGAAARTATRQRLERVRRPGFDGQPPDIGNIAAHPSAGAAVVGARNFLIAYNVLLSTSDVAAAQTIARKIRESSGGFPYVKAMGVRLASQNRAQVSMNLTNFAETDLEAVYCAIESEAKRLGASAGPGELIGFIPRRAYEHAPAFFRRADNFNESRIIENRLSQLSSVLKPQR
jgi:glutamate formiminotransferase